MKATRRNPNLKPCPFCGSAEVCITQHPGAGVPIVYEGHCDDCYAEGPSCDSAEDAIERWNNRVSRGAAVAAGQERWWYDDEQQVVVDVTIPAGRTAAPSYPVCSVAGMPGRCTRTAITELGERIARVPELEREVDRLRLNAPHGRRDQRPADGMVGHQSNSLS